MTEIRLTSKTLCRRLAAGDDETATVGLLLDAVLWEICRELECEPDDSRLRLLDNTRRRYCSFVLWGNLFIGTLWAKVQDGHITGNFHPEGQGIGY